MTGLAARTQVWHPGYRVSAIPGWGWELGDP